MVVTIRTISIGTTRKKLKGKKLKKIPFGGMSLHSAVQKTERENEINKNAGCFR